MAGAFQADAFQNDAFQLTGVVPPSPGGSVGGVIIAPPIREPRKGAAHLFGNDVLRARGVVFNEDELRRRVRRFLSSLTKES